MGILESLPVQRVRPSLCLPLFLGTLRDASGFDNHIDTSTGTKSWQTCGNSDGLVNAQTGLATVADSAELQLTEGTFFVWGNFAKYNGLGDRLISKRDAGGTNYDFHLNTDTRIGFYDGAATRFATVNWLGSRSIATTFQSGTLSQGYVDGAFVAAYTVANTVTVDDAPVSIGNIYTATAPNTNQLFGVLVYRDQLTPAEIALLHTWSQDRFTPRKQWYGGGIGGTARFLDNFQAARVTLANETSGLLSNTSLTINTGTWAIAEDAIGKYALCAGNGQLQYNLQGAAGFTVDSFDETGDATITLNANNFQVDALAGDIIRTIRIVA